MSNHNWVMAPNLVSGDVNIKVVVKCDNHAISLHLSDTGPAVSITLESGIPVVRVWSVEQESPTHIIPLWSARTTPQPPPKRERPICHHDTMMGSAPEVCADCEQERRAEAEVDQVLRNQFAASVLKALVTDFRRTSTPREAAELAYQYADAMLEAAKPKRASL